ncbi:MAG: ABC transporter permease [Clostridia bacterium]|nr:ABC transporter permease [Clostridia bacterium]
MMRLIKYLRVCSKRTLKLLPVLMCFTILLSACVVFILGSLLEDEESSDKNVRLSIGLVGDIEGSYLGMGVSAVKEFDSSRFYVDFLPLEHSEAEEALKKNEIIGYVYVPEDFVSGVIHGENPKLKYIETDTPAALSPMLTREIIGIVSDLVLESRAGVYAMGDLAFEYGADRSEVRDGEEALNLRYFDAVLSREEMYDLNITGTGRGLGFADYYTLSFILILMLLWGILCVPLLGTANMELPRLLYSTGTGTLSQVISEYIPFLAMILTNTGILCFGIGALKEIGVLFSGFRGLLYLLPCAALITSMQFFLYEITSNVISAVLVQLLSALGLSYVSGLIYPSSSLPGAVSVVGDLTPTGVCFNYMSEIYIQDPGLAELLPVILYLTIFILASALVRRAKIRRMSI